MDSLVLNDRVCIMGKNVSGKIAYIGETHISKGEWFGVVLDEPKGRNNGCVDGKRYFKCPRHYGIFVRACQLERESLSAKTREKTVYPNYLSVSPHARACLLDEEMLSMKDNNDPKSSLTKNYDSNFTSNSQKEDENHPTHDGCRESDGELDTADRLNTNDIQSNYRKSLCRSEEYTIRKRERSDEWCDKIALYTESFVNLSQKDVSNEKNPQGLVPCADSSMKTNSKQPVLKLPETFSYSQECSSENRFLDTVTTSEHNKESQILSRNDLRRMSNDLKNAKHQTAEIEKKLRVVQGKNTQLRDELDKMAKSENKKKRQLVTAQKQVLAFKKELRITKKDLELSETNRDYLQSKMLEIREITEHVIVEKEMAEEKSDHFEFLLGEESEKCRNLEIEVEIMREEMQIQCIDGVPALHLVKKLQNEKQVFRSALYRLKQLCEALRDELSITKLENDEKLRHILGLKEASKDLQNVISTQEVEITELCDTIDSVMFVDEILVEVTDRSHSYEDQIRTLHLELNDVEEELEVTESIVDNLEAIKQICTEDIERLKLELKNAETALEVQKLASRIKEKEIEKYQELTRKLKRGNAQMSTELKLAREQRSEAIVEAESLKLQGHRGLRRGLKDLVEVEILKVCIDNLREKLKYWFYFLLDGIADEDGKNIAIDEKLLASMVMKKLNILVVHLRHKLSEHGENPNPETFCTVLKVSTIMEFALKLKSVFVRFSSRFDEMHLEELYTMDKCYNHMLHMNSKIDDYLRSLCNNEIDRRENLESIQADYVETLNNFHLQVKNNDFLMEDLEHYLIGAQVRCRTLLVLCGTIIANNINDSDARKLKQILDSAKSLDKNITKVLIHWQTSIKECEFLKLDVFSSLKKNFECLQETTNIVTSIHDGISDTGGREKETTIDNEKSSLLCEKWIELSKCQIQLEVSLKDDPIFLEHGRKVTKPSVIEAWAKNVRQNEKRVVAGLKQRIISLESELSKLTQELQREKTNSFKCALLETEITRLRKNSDNALDNQRNSSQTAFEHLLEMPNETQPTTAPVFSMDCSSTQQCTDLYHKDLQHTLGYLSRKNWDLRMNQARLQKSCLEPLKVLPAMKYNSDSGGIGKLQKRLGELLSKLTPLLVPHVVNITGKNENKGEKYERYLLNRALARKSIEEEIWNVQCELQRLKSERRVFS